MKSFLVGAGSLLLAAAGYAQVTPAPTQPAAAKTGRSAITGIVVDSLHGYYLAGAEVLVEGARTSVFTDSLGRFSIDSLPAGTYQLGVFHPLLDTLGIALATRPFHLGPDSASVVILAIPSAPTLVAKWCPARPRAQGTSAVIGEVVDPETLQPVRGADVSIAWVEIEISKEIGVRQSPRVIRDSTDASGRFRLCGLPNSTDANLQAKRGNSVTAQVPIALGDEATSLVARTLLLSAVDSGATTGTAVVSGRVLLEGSPVVGGSRVELAGTDIVATTDQKGEFTLRNLPSGTHLLVARHLGYAADAVAVDLSAREPKRVSMILPKFVNIMDPVLVTARRTAGLERVGFARRQKAGTGYYLGPEQIARMRPNRLTDILRQVPGLRVDAGVRGETVRSSRGVTTLTSGCVQYYVDDFRWQSAEPGDINHFVSGHEIVGVEVYQGSNVPAQFATAGLGNCTTIVLWTRMRIRD